MSFRPAWSKELSFRIAKATQRKPYLKKLKRKTKKTNATVINRKRRDSRRERLSSSQLVTTDMG